MGFVFFTALAFLLLVTFVCVPKKLHATEIAFVWLTFMGVLITAFDTAVPLNSDYFKPTTSPLLYTAHLLYEFLILPVVVLLYLDSTHRLRSWIAKLATFVICFCVLRGLEGLAVFFHLFKYVQWNPWWSLLVWVIVLCFVNLLQTGMRAVMKREGTVL
jgi:hypothetical protein